MFADESGGQVSLGIFPEFEDKFAPFHLFIYPIYLFDSRIKLMNNMYKTISA